MEIIRRRLETGKRCAVNDSRVNDEMRKTIPARIARSYHDPTIVDVRVLKVPKPSQPRLMLDPIPGIKAMRMRIKANKAAREKAPMTVTTTEAIRSRVVHKRIVKRPAKRMMRVKAPPYWSKPTLINELLGLTERIIETMVERASNVPIQMIGCDGNEIDPCRIREIM